MRYKIFPLFVIVLVCAFSAVAQTVIESESSVIIGDKTANVSLVIDSPKVLDGQIELELLDQNDQVRARSADTARIRAGKKAYKLTIPLGDLIKKTDDEIAWYRLYYRIGQNAGIVSLSELMKDVFDLRAAVAENVFAGMNYRVRVRTLRPFTKQPVKNVEIEADLKLDLDTDADEDELHLKAKAKTNGDGFAVLDFKIPDNAKLDYDGDLKLTARKNGVVREIDEDLDANNEKELALFTTDKPLYQPGQDFHVRGLFLDGSKTVQPDKEVEFKIYDEDETVLYRETVKTSPYGIASVSWKIPDNTKLGNYHVEIEDCGLCRAEFKISRYDLPNFTVSTSPDKAFYRFNDKQAAITVKADYLFGKSVTKGKVRVVQESDRHWNWREQKYDVDEGETVEGETDSEGKFVAKLNLTNELSDLSRSSWRRFTDLSFAAYFTDLTTNRTEQRRFDIRLTKEPIHIYLMEYANQSPNLPVTAYISTFYADGTPANCEVEITGNYENVLKREQLIRIKTNSFGAGKLQFSLPEKKGSNNFEMHVIARDRNGQVGTFDENFNVDDEDALKISTEKAIYTAGESVGVNLLSTQQRGFVYVDVVKDWDVIDSYFVELKKGKARLTIPYDPKFKGDLTIAAYTDDHKRYDYPKMRANRGIIFPAQQNLKLNAKFSSATYRPNEEASVKFSVLNGIGQTVESALGVVVFDKAIEERAKTDAAFGSYFSRYFGLLGYDKSFGNITLKDLNDLDTSKPISPEMQLAAEVMLANSYYYPNIYHSEYDDTEAKSLYGEAVKKQMVPVEAAVKKQYEKDGAHPTDPESLKKILSASGINFDDIKDPWGQSYIPVFTIDRTQDIVTLKTAGADKKLNTNDDFNASSSAFGYFAHTGELIEKTILDYHQRSGKYVRDMQTLSTVLAEKGFDVSKLKDRWGRDYRITFEVAGRTYLVRFHSDGPDGIFEDQSYGYRSDDFDVSKSYVDYFYKTENEIGQIFSKTVNIGKKAFPKDEAEFKRVLTDGGLSFDSIVDGYGQPAYLTPVSQTVYGDKTTVENGKQKITPVTNEILTFHLRSKGQDGMIGTRDDFDLATFSSVITEMSKLTQYSKGEVQNFVYSGANGAIKGTVVDPNGAVVPGAEITATSEGDNARVFKAVTKDNGEFLLENLPSGKYTVVVAAHGFMAYKQESIVVRSQNLVQINVSLNIGATSETVSVTAEAVQTETSSSSTSNTVTKSSGKITFPYANQNSTPRLRQYFPETLFWNPELITDKKGKAELKFKLADNITTWKMYTIASTKSGKVGVAEKEVTAFQPFFVDLDPPKSLTEGDEIYLPTQVRNYTTKAQKVDVAMERADWFSMLNANRQQVNVAAGDAQNAVFGFKTTNPIKDGKQRVTAIAQTDSDAIEKPVTVRPNGQEVVHADSDLFTGDEKIALSFPSNALPKTQKAELKIYPNLYAQISDSVEGLLERPYGCGEQTISSTYPNLMILKFVKPDSALAAKAKKYLQKGYERLLGYQVADGGFSYWGGKDTSDIGLTAYALRFLTDASSQIDVDQEVIKKAQACLLRQQRADGGWTQRYRGENSDDPSRAKITTTYVARSLSMLQKLRSATQSNNDADQALKKALAYLKSRNSEIGEPYALALFGLALIDAGDDATAATVAKTLEAMAIDEGSAVYWKLETNTPFYGWGTAGRVETTALVTQLLLRLSQKDPSAPRQDLINKATLFLLKNKDRYGIWYSTQTTINVLDAFLATLGTEKQAGPHKIDVLVNGEVFKTLDVAPDQVEATSLDLTGRVNSNVSNIEVRSSGNSPVMTQLVASHYVDWKDSAASNLNVDQSRAIRLDYKCDKQNAAIMQEVNCSVRAERVGFSGYGMLLAEIGTPPGADVDRESLEKAIESDWSISHYEVLPDRIIVYMWAKAGGTGFNFKFRPRYAINAQTPASVVYDYYNPEAQGMVTPLRFTVK